MISCQGHFFKGDCKNRPRHKMVRLSFKFYYSIVSKILCFIGCVYQMIRINEIYFSYETVTNVKYQDENLIDLPGITICNNKFDQVKQELQNDPGYKEELLNELKIGEQINYFENFPRILNQCKLFDPKNRGFEVCQDQFKETFFDLENYCFTFYSQLNQELDEKYILKAEGNEVKSKYMSKITLKKLNMDKSDLTNLVVIKFHDRKQRPFRAFETGLIMINLDVYNFVLIKYRKTVVNYKFIPAGKYCFEGETRNDCLANCEIGEFIKHKSKYPSYFLSNGSTYNMIFSTDHEYNEFNFSKNCSKMCGMGVDCYKEYFFVWDKEMSDKFFRINLNEIIIIIEFPTHPTTIYEISLKMSFEEYLCLIASILSLWFGFSILLIH